MKLSTVILLTVLVLLLGGAAAFAWQSTRPASDVSETDLQKTFQESVEKAKRSTPSPDTADNSAQEVRTAAVGFILAVAHPDKPLSPAARKKGLRYLSEDLRKEVSARHGGDPARLLELQEPSRFTVSNPGGGANERTIRISFQQPGGTASRIFTLSETDGAWLISKIEKDTAARQ